MSSDTPSGLTSSQRQVYEFMTRQTGWVRPCEIQKEIEGVGSTGVSGRLNELAKRGLLEHRKSGRAAFYRFPDSDDDDDNENDHDINENSPQDTTLTQKERIRRHLHTHAGEEFHWTDLTEVFPNMADASVRTRLPELRSEGEIEKVEGRRGYYTVSEENADEELQEDQSVVAEYEVTATTTYTIKKL